jgi:hypothetical protein
MGDRVRDRGLQLTLLATKPRGSAGDGLRLALEAQVKRASPSPKASRHLNSRCKETLSVTVVARRPAPYTLSITAEGRVTLTDTATKYWSAFSPEAEDATSFTTVGRPGYYDAGSLVASCHDLAQLIDEVLVKPIFSLTREPVAATFLAPTRRFIS